MQKTAIPEGIKAERNEYSFAGAPLPAKAAFRLMALQNKIRKADLGDLGRELQPHITVKYGIKSDDVADLREVLKGVPPIRARLGDVSLFKNPKHDVLKIDVDSEDLQRVHELISNHFDNDDTWPEYRPHATIAYLKPGMGKNYLNLNQLAGEELVFDYITFRDRKGQKHRIRLGEAPAMNKAAFLQGYTTRKGQ
jgi:2'-5' RNA ligase